MNYKNDKKTEKTTPSASEDVVDIETIKKERDQYLDGWKRAKADFINYKRGEAQRLESIISSANQQLIRDLLNVLDSFDLAIEALEKEKKAEKGMYLIRTQLEDILKKFGLERVVVSVGMPFDPALHEAVAVVKSEQKSDTVVEEVERGYKLEGKLLRPARVKVAQ